MFVLVYSLGPASCIVSGSNSANDHFLGLTNSLVKTFARSDVPVLIGKCVSWFDVITKERMVSVGTICSRAVQISIVAVNFRCASKSAP